MRVAFIILISLNANLLFAFQAKPYDFPKKVDTTTKEIFKQERKTFQLQNGVVFDNTFKSANMGKLMEEDTFYLIEVLPENRPINYSPWYAFKVWAAKDTVVQVVMDYGEYKYGQRYWPKLSSDGVNWAKLNESSFTKIDSSKVSITLNLSKAPLWVSAQEIQNSDMVNQWIQTQTGLERATFKTIGKTTLGRDIPLIEYVAEKNKPTIIVLSRQHPPEVTGYLAMKSFVERIFDVEDELSEEFLASFNVLVFPLMNPDGVDLGHWRHNAGGVDLNRDWAYYNQPETRQVADYIVSFAAEKKSDIVLGLDFHSTWKDIYYTNVDSLESALPKFTNDWITNIKARIEDSEAKVSASGIGQPVSKAWFYTQFKATGITYEIGDNTPRDLIKVKGKVSAEEMMKLLLTK